MEQPPQQLRTQPPTREEMEILDRLTEEAAAKGQVLGEIPHVLQVIRQGLQKERLAEGQRLGNQLEREVMEMMRRDRGEQSPTSNASTPAPKNS